MTQRRDTKAPLSKWTVTAQPRRTNPVTTALTAGAIANLIALATLATILLDGPIWLVLTGTITTALTAGIASQNIRAIP